MTLGSNERMIHKVGIFLEDQIGSYPDRAFVVSTVQHSSLVSTECRQLYSCRYTIVYTDPDPESIQYAASYSYWIGTKLNKVSRPRPRFPERNNWSFHRGANEREVGLRFPVFLFVLCTLSPDFDSIVFELL